MSFDEELELALKSPEPLQQLRRLVQNLYAEGLDQPTVLGLFEKARAPLREAGREQDEDTLLEVMDFLVGWCSPAMSLATPKQAPGPVK